MPLQAEQRAAEGTQLGAHGQRAVWYAPRKDFLPFPLLPNRPTCGIMQVSETGAQQEAPETVQEKDKAVFPWAALGSDCQSKGVPGTKVLWAQLHAKAVFG